jgi:two-component system response regulator RegA
MSDDLTDPGVRNRLLLIDDDQVFSVMLAKALVKRGFQVRTAFDIRAARRELDTFTPDYVVLDLKIGPESGLTLIEELLEANSEVNILMLTGYASVATAVEAIKLGAVHYLTKPVSADDVVKALHKTEGDAEAAVEINPVSVKRLEWEHMQKVLLEHDGNISAAARAMGMHRRTLQRKLQKKPVTH